MVSDSSTSVAENSSLMFTSADFTDNFTDAEPNAALEDVQITALPQQGMLALSGTAVTAGQVIAAADLVDLTYAPDTTTPARTISGGTRPTAMSTPPRRQR